MVGVINGERGQSPLSQLGLTGDMKAGGGMRGGIRASPSDFESSGVIAAMVYCLLQRELVLAAGLVCHDVFHLWPASKWLSSISPWIQYCSGKLAS